MSETRISMDELATRAGVPTELVKRLVDAQLLTPDPSSLVDVKEVSLVNLVGSLEAAGMSVEVLSEAAKRNQLSFAFLDLVLGRPESLVGEETFEDQCARLGADPATVSETVEAAGLPRPQLHDRLRKEDVQGITDVTIALALAGAPLISRLMRVHGESLRRVTEMEAHIYHLVFEEPLLASGLSEQQMRDQISQMSPEVQGLAERVLMWIYKRHRDHETLSHLIGHIEEAVSAADVGYARSKFPPAVGFADLTDYTGLTERQGDYVAVEVAAAFSQLVTRDAAECGGRPLKWLGDGVMVYFPQPAQSARFALELVEHVAQAELPPVHIGLSAGPVIYQDGDYYGKTVNLAARVATQAVGGEVLVTQEVVDNCSLEDVDFSSIGAIPLKGIATPVMLHRATRI
jgi:adenylate cyclase